MLKIGVLGTGHLGKIHIKCIKMIENYELVGFYDADSENAKKVSEEFEIPSFNSVDELLDNVDVVDIVTPTISHFDCASAALAKRKHVFIEKPVVATPDEANKLMVLAKAADVKIQVGHVERFNPAFLAAQPFINKPIFVEAHRLALFNPRGTDVPVVLDLMIHDIDIILSIFRSPVKSISANGVPVVSDTADIANARIEFENGAIANLTTSRISMKNMRKIRIFQRDAYISVDLLDKKSEIVKIKDVIPSEVEDPFAMILELGEGKGHKQVIFEHPKVENINAIKTELETFSEAIIHNKKPLVSIEDGCMALEIAYKILDQIEKQADANNI